MWAKFHWLHFHILYTLLHSSCITLLIQKNRREEKMMSMNQSMNFTEHSEIHIFSWRWCVFSNYEVFDSEMFSSISQEEDSRTFFPPSLCLFHLLLHKGGGYVYIYPSKTPILCVTERKGNLNLCSWTRKWAEPPSSSMEDIGRYPRPCLWEGGRSLTGSKGFVDSSNYLYCLEGFTFSENLIIFFSPSET